MDQSDLYAELRWQPIESFYENAINSVTKLKLLQVDSSFAPASHGVTCLRVLALLGHVLCQGVTLLREHAQLGVRRRRQLLEDARDNEELCVRALAEAALVTQPRAGRQQRQALVQPS